MESRRQATIDDSSTDVVSGSSVPQTTGDVDNTGDDSSRNKKIWSGSGLLTGAVGVPRSNGGVDRRILGEFVTGELAGDESAPQESSTTAGPHEELGNAEGAESGEEFAEATAEQLAAAESGETAASDLTGEGFEGSEAGEGGEEFDFGGIISTVSSLFESGEGTEEAGEAVEGANPEFFGILASLVPLLLSSVGPSLAKGVMNRLSKRTKRTVKRLAKTGVGLASLVAKKLQESAEVGEAGEESGMEIVDEATVVEAARHVESILGIDTRKNIARTTRQPWRHICALRIEFPSGKVYTGTGFFVGPRAVVTAGHCVYLHNQGGWARKIMVIPGANGSSQPLGSAISTTFRSVGGWVNGKKPECDYGCVILPSGTAFRSNPGSLGFAAFDTGKLLAKTAVLYGYPGDKPFGELWGDKRRIKTVTSKNLIYEIDTMGGQSGSPVYIKQNGQRFAVGIHNYGGATSNSATRITQDVYRRLYAWSQIGGM